MVKQLNDYMTGSSKNCNMGERGKSPFSPELVMSALSDIITCYHFGVRAHCTIYFFYYWRHIWI